MAVSTKKCTVYIEPRRKNDRERLVIEIPKGKRDIYKAAAQELCLSLSKLVQNGVEEYIRNHFNEKSTITNKNS